MAGRYIIVNYKRARDTEPRISFRTDDLTEAEAKFTIYEERGFRSVVLYDTGTKTVRRSVNFGRRIYLVKAYEKAEGDKGALKKAAYKIVAKEAAGIGIEQMAITMGGISVPGLGGAVVDLCKVPYFAGKGDGAAATGAAASAFGGLLGAKVGNEIGGNIGAWIGGFAGGLAANALASNCIDSLITESQKCTACEGKGLVHKYRCTRCNGNGYR